MFSLLQMLNRVNGCNGAVPLLQYVHLNMYSEKILDLHQWASQTYVTGVTYVHCEPTLNTQKHRSLAEGMKNLDQFMLTLLNAICICLSLPFLGTDTLAPSPFTPDRFTVLWSPLSFATH